MNFPELQAMANDIADIKSAILSNRTVYPPKDAANYLGIALSTLYKLTSSGKIRFSKPGGKMIYFAKADLDNYLLSVVSMSPDELEKAASTYESTKK